MMPVRTSPVPAVARRRSVGRIDRRVSFRRRDHGARPLEQHDRVGRARELARRGDAIVTNGMACEPFVLTGVRREHRRGQTGRVADVQRRRIDGERVQRVGVDDDGDRRLGDQPAGRGLRAVVAAEARTDRERCGSA